ncbi:MAG TPA: DUF4369 domain-containing protein [Flavobacteriaceae bacterium]|nr:DUF4369 domain-containing protein [Flavobacteriaceae bacterium]
MMKNLLILLLSASLLFACSKEKESNLHIIGKIEGLKKGELFLQKIEDDTLIVNLDSLKIDGNPNFQFHTYLESPQLLFLYLNRKGGDKNDDIIKFFAEKGEMGIQGNLRTFPKKAVVTGSKNHDALEKYLEMIKKYDERNLDLLQKSFEAGKTDDQKALLKIDQRYDQLLRAKYLYTVNFAINHKNMEIAPFLAISEVYDANINYLDTIYNSLTKEVKKSKYGKSLKKLLKERRELERLNEKVQEQ